MDIRPLLADSEAIPAAVAQHVADFAQGTL